VATRKTTRTTTPAPATRSRPRTARRAPSSRGRAARGATAWLTPEVVRSILGTGLMALGAITLIALVLPGEGALTDWWRDSIAPWFETGRWLLPFLLLGGGWYIAAGPGKEPGSGWGMTLGGLTVAYIAGLGAFEVLQLDVFDTERGGGRVGRFLADTLGPLLTEPGTFVLLLAIAVIGLLVAFDLRLRQLTDPVTGTARWVVTTAASSVRRDEARRAADRDGGRAAGPPPDAKGRGVKAANGLPAGAVPISPGEPPPLPRSILDEPAPRHTSSPVSQTVWMGTGEAGAAGGPARAAATGPAGSLTGANGANGTTNGIGPEGDARAGAPRWPPRRPPRSNRSRRRSGRCPPSNSSRPESRATSPGRWTTRPTRAASRRSC
jgi:hypothetical protein